MASQEDLYRLLGRALIDAEFRAALADDPAAAAASMGVTLSGEQEAALRASDLGKMALAQGSTTRARR